MGASAQNIINAFASPPPAFGFEKVVVVVARVRLIILDPMGAANIGGMTFTRNWIDIAEPSFYIPVGNGGSGGIG